MKLVRLGAVMGVLIALAAACGSGSEAITVTDAWGRTSPNAATNAAFYMSLTGGESSDVLVAADIGECTVVELHETVSNDGVMQMQHLPAGIAFDEGQTVLFEPGGKHIMCIDKLDDFAPGDTLAVTLSFETADDIIVEFEIRDG